MNKFKIIHQIFLTYKELITSLHGAQVDEGSVGAWSCYLILDLSFPVQSAKEKHPWLKSRVTLEPLQSARSDIRRYIVQEEGSDKIGIPVAEEEWRSPFHFDILTYINEHVSTYSKFFLMMILVERKMIRKLLTLPNDLNWMESKHCIGQYFPGPILHSRWQSSFSHMKNPFGH